MVCILYIYTYIIVQHIYIYLFFCCFCWCGLLKQRTHHLVRLNRSMERSYLFRCRRGSMFPPGGGGTGRLPTSQIYQRLWCFHIFVLLFFCFCFESSWTSSLKTLEWCCLWQSLLKVWYLIAPWNSNWNKLDLKPTRSTALQSLPVKRMMCGARIWGKLSCHFQTKLQWNNLRSYFIRWCCVSMLGKPSRCGLFSEAWDPIPYCSRFF